MLLEILHSINICPVETFNFGEHLAWACRGIGDMSFAEFMTSFCVKFVGAVAIAPFVEVVQDAIASWGDTGSTGDTGGADSSGDTGSTGGTGDTGYVSNPATEVTLAELLGEQHITLQDVIAAN